jgi:hypothetical protein
LNNLINSNFDFTYDKTDPANKKLLIIHYQNKHMRQLYALYGETIIIDATYKVNYNNYSLYIMVVVDKHGCSQICSIALLSCEKEPVFNSYLQHFTNHNDIKQTKVILSDKDMVEAHGFATFFPDATHLLCIWHVNKNFKQYFKNQDQLDILNSMIHAKSQAIYDDLLIQLNSISNKKQYDYFTTNWHSIQPKWVAFHRNDIITLGFYFYIIIVLIFFY